MPTLASYELWASAQAEALVAEQALLRTMLAATERKGPLAQDGQLKAARQLRQKSITLFGRVLVEMEQLARPGPLIYFEDST
jgi:hypothetical protein